MAPKIETPVKGYNGVVAGVSFTNGEGHTEDSNALAYFERHGYTIGEAVGGSADGSAGGLSPKQKLQAEAKELGLSEEGTKAELEARIAEHKAQNPPTGEGDPDGAPAETGENTDGDDGDEDGKDDGSAA